MKIVSITTIKNESDIIESFVRYHLNIFDLIIILDNGSTDDTSSILNNLIDEKLPLVVINDKDKYFEPQEKYNFLVKIAFNDYDADIVCPLDADEFLTWDDGNPRDILENMDENTYFKVMWRTYVPTELDENSLFIPSKIKHIRDENIETMPKIILTKKLFYDYNAEIGIGNHSLMYSKAFDNIIICDERDDLKIAHFPLRSIEQTMSKVMVSYPNTLSRKIVRASRSHHYPLMFFKIHDEGKIDLTDVSEFAKQYSLEENKGKTKLEKRNIPIYYHPLNLEFCQDIDIKYGYTLRPFTNVLDNYVYFANELHRFKNETANLRNNIEKLENETQVIVDARKLFDACFDNNNLNLKKVKIFSNLLNKNYSDITVAIKTPNPSNEKHWGDYFFALSLQKSFSKKGFNAIIHPKDHWYENENVDIAIVIRGLREYDPNDNQINIMWNISHPDNISLREFEKFDCVFIASNEFAKEIGDKVNTVVKPLLQCTDPEIFYPSKTEDFNDEILFVGVSRGVFRPIIKDMTKTSFDFSVYGMEWEDFIDERFIKGNFIDNDKLNKAYSSCKILLNDHWDDMKEKNFPSNRLFDALACGAFVISDEIPAAKDLFNDNIITYSDYKDLNQKISYYLKNDNEREKIANEGRKIVLNNHTFDHRVDYIINFLSNPFLEKIITSYIKSDKRLLERTIQLTRTKQELINNEDKLNEIRFRIDAINESNPQVFNEVKDTEIEKLNNQISDLNNVNNNQKQELLLLNQLLKNQKKNFENKIEKLNLQISDLNKVNNNQKHQLLISNQLLNNQKQRIEELLNNLEESEPSRLNKIIGLLDDKK